MRGRSLFGTTSEGIADWWEISIHDGDLYLIFTHLARKTADGV